MKVLVTGGRTFADRPWLWAGLDLLHSKAPITQIIEGGAPGADIRAQEWAKRHDIDCLTCPADWGQYGRSAGYIRNDQMAKLKPDVVLACPGGKGTANMVDIARRYGLKVIFLEKMPVVPSVPRTPPETWIESYAVSV